MSKKKLVVNYDKLPAGVLRQVELQYPDGWMNHVFKVQGPKEIFFHAILVETEEVDYLVKVKIKKDRKGVDADEDFLPEFNDLSSDSGEEKSSGYGDDGGHDSSDD